MQVRGTCRILTCHDVSRRIDLGAAERSLASSHRTSFQHKGNVLTNDRVSPPLRGSWSTPSLSIGSWRTEEACELSVYGLGCLVITWTIAFDGQLEDLVSLSALLYENEELQLAALAVAADVVEELGDSVDSPALSTEVEDYVCYVLGALPAGVSSLEVVRSELARVLRAEEGELSTQEVTDALDAQVSYLASDACYVDWLGALLFGEDVADELLVLELANVELLKLRLLDLRLDGEILEAYRVLARRPGLFRGFAFQRQELARIGRMQAEDAILHEGIDNALKLFGDDYLARLYRTAGARFHFNDWDASIQRNLGVLRGIYESLADLSAHRRAEALEWIIIVLIAVDIVIHFFPV